MAKTRIFDTDPDAKPKARAASGRPDYAGQFKLGYQTPDGLPATVSAWRVVTATRETAERIAELYKGTPAEWETTTDYPEEVYTEAAKVLAILDGPSAVTSDLKQWANGKLIHHCDGVSFLSHLVKEELVGTPCGCPELLEERIELAKNNMGPKPDIRISFRLVDDQDLGLFLFQTGSWSLLRVLWQAEEDLERIDGESLVELEIIELDNKWSTKLPRVTVVKAFAEAIVDAA